MRQPIIDILRRYSSAAFLWERIERLFNRYGIDDWPPPAEAITISKEEGDLDFIAANPKEMKTRGPTLSSRS
ncbi:MAG: hypothetical protein LAP87_04260 [Acidobacteriia bacterium]|nr:hypothetical protein [Terriglobia bacterium]